MNSILAASPRVALGGPTIVGAALFLFCILLGGGGSEGLAQSALIEGLSSALALWMILTPAPSSASTFRSKAVMLLALALLAFQLVPLPPQIWHSLPGRALQVESLALIGEANSWRPVSIDPSSTVRFLLAFATPIAVFLAVERWGRALAQAALIALVAAAVASTCLGILQIGLDYPPVLTWFDGPSLGAGAGIFANPNHHATFLSIAMIATVLVPVLRPEPRVSAVGVWTIVSFLALGVLSTGARGGLVLLILVIPICAAITARSSALARPMMIIGLAALAIAAVGALYPDTNRLAFRESFEFGSDARAVFMPDLFYSTQHFWPVGSGFGTFVQAFAANEDLDQIGPAFVNHAHNELFEWLIEGGALAVMALLLVSAAIIVAFSRRMRGSDPRVACGGAAMLLVILIHSLFDYPLRTDAIAACAGLAAALAACRLSTSTDEAAARTATRRTSLRTVATLAGCTIIGAWAATLLLSEWATRSGRSELALTLSPYNPRAAANAAQDFAAIDPAAAAAFAHRAIDAAPWLQSGVSTLAVLQEGPESDAAWTVSAKLGWRDIPTQWWAMRQAISSGEMKVAAERADALLRSSRTNDKFLPLIRRTLDVSAFRREFVERLLLNPAWRKSLFTIPVSSTDHEAAALTATLEDVKRRGGSIRGDEVHALVARAISLGRYDEALSTWRLAGRQNLSRGTVFDALFEQESQAYASSGLSFDWTVRRSGSASASVEDGILLADTSGEQKIAVAEQLVRLPAGTWAAELKMTRRPELDGSFALVVECRNGATRSAILNLDPDGPHTRTVEFETGPGCTFVKLALLALSSGRADHVEIDKVEISRAL